MEQIYLVEIGMKFDIIKKRCYNKNKKRFLYEIEHESRDRTTRATT